MDENNFQGVIKMKKINLKSIITAILMLVFGTAVYAKNITVSVGAGENWQPSHKPQFAVWLEDEKGNFLRTLYVTKKASGRTWIFSPKEGRPESLPVWYHSSKNETAVKSKVENEKLDAVTSATPKGGVIFIADIPDEGCTIKAEFNTSFDYNDFFTKKNSGVNGQPSVVYVGKIPSDLASGEEIRLEFAGCGSLDGSSGNIETENISRLTTAVSIVKTVAVAGK